MSCWGEEVGDGGDKIQEIRKVYRIEEHGGEEDRRERREERGRRWGSRDREKDVWGSKRNEERKWVKVVEIGDS